MYGSSKVRCLPVKLPVVLAQGMPPHKRKLDASSLFCNHGELVGMPRRQILALLKKVRDGQIDATGNLHIKSIDADYNFRFERVSVTHVFELDPAKAKAGEAPFQLEVADPGLLIQHVLSESTTLAQEYVDALSIHPGTQGNPWRLVVGFDEYVPGSQYNFENNKKVMALYFTFSEVFSHKSSCWFAPFVIRTRYANKVRGGMSAVMNWFLKRMLWGPHGINSVGATFTLEGLNYVFYAQLAILISDADGHRCVLGWRGANCFKPCPRHMNVWRKDSDLAHRLDGQVEITCTDSSLMRVGTKQEFEDACDLVAEACRRWQASAIPKTVHKNVRNSNGMNWIAGGLAYDLEVRAKTEIHNAITMDWVHTFLQDGVVTVEAWLVLSAHGYGDGELRVAIELFFQRGWNFPHSFQSKGDALWRVFSEYRLGEDEEFDKIRASASEVLGMYSLLRVFLDTEVQRTEATRAQWESWTALCKVMDYIMLARNRRTPDMKEAAKELRVRYQRFYMLRQGCYGTAYVKPKHHYPFDVADQFERDGEVYDQFIIERMHLLVQAVAPSVDYMGRYEKSLLSGMLNAQMNELKSYKGGCCLMDAKPTQVPNLPHTWFADQLQIWGKVISVKDVVIIESPAAETSIGLFLSVVQENGGFFGLVEIWSFVARISRTMQRWRRGDTIELYEAELLHQAVAWIDSEPGCVDVVMLM